MANDKTIKVKGASVTIGDVASDVYVETLSYKFSNTSRTVNPLNQSGRVILVGQGQGSGSITNMIGLGSSLRGLVEAINGSDQCEFGTITINLSNATECAGTSADSISLTGVVAVGSSVQVQDSGDGMTIGKGSIQFIFMSDGSD